jgi:tripartite-type tricarboxylate transporter receptor subunit TctC
MKLPRRRFLHLAAGAAALPAVSRIASAQAYPTRPITMIVPFAAGGPTDVIGRIVAEHMSRTLGQRVIVENFAGAGGTNGTSRAMRASPDGYTIQVGQLGTHVAALAFYPNLAYKPDEDFAPIGLVAEHPMLIVGKKDIPVNNAREFIAYAKTNNEKLTMSHAGVGSVTHFTCLLFNSLLEIKPVLVPFNSSALAMNAVIAGHVDYMCGTSPDVIPQIQSGGIKVFAVGSVKRLPTLPNVPTSKEAGLPEFLASPWFALFAPKDTPRPILDRLTDALDRALDDENVPKRLLELGCDVPEKARRGQQPLASLIRSDIARWVPVIKAANN